MQGKNDNAAASVRGMTRENARPRVVRSEHRAENPGIRKEEDEFRLDSWMQIRSTGWHEKKWSSSVLLARRPPAFH